MPVAASPLQAIEGRLAPLRQQLTDHPLYSRIRTINDLRVFMESHVFAVWDFMSLLKALQCALTCVRVPWTPSAYPASRRFINEIVLDEESDVFDGRTVSHFELYVEAMRECGANVQPVLVLQQELACAVSLDGALDRIHAPAAARSFVALTFAVIDEGRPHAIAAAFTYGREDLIPNIFRSLVRDLDRQLSGRLRKFVWYLERHIELDGDDHGPLALRMIEDLCGDDSDKWSQVAAAAESALRARLALWDGIAAQLGHAR
jgi:hypothetical protein